MLASAASEVRFGSRMAGETLLLLLASTTLLLLESTTLLLVAGATLLLAALVLAYSGLRTA